MKDFMGYCSDQCSGGRCSLSSMVPRSTIKGIHSNTADVISRQNKDTTTKNTIKEFNGR